MINECKEINKIPRIKTFPSVYPYHVLWKHNFNNMKIYFYTNFSGDLNSSSFLHFLCKIVRISTMSFLGDRTTILFTYYFPRRYYVMCQTTKIWFFSPPIYNILMHIIYLDTVKLYYVIYKCVYIRVHLYISLPLFFLGGKLTDFLFIYI